MDRECSFSNMAYQEQRFGKNQTTTKLNVDVMKEEPYSSMIYQ